MKKLILATLLLPLLVNSGNTSELHKVYEDLEHPLYNDIYLANISAYNYPHGVLLLFRDADIEPGRWLLSDETLISGFATTFLPEMNWNDDQKCWYYLKTEECLHKGK